MLLRRRLAVRLQGVPAQARLPLLVKNHEKVLARSGAGFSGICRVAPLWLQYGSHRGAVGHPRDPAGALRFDGIRES